jgi:hypothetical protein
MLLNVSFGIFAFMPQGWLFMCFVILLECVVLSGILTKSWYVGRIYSTAVITNIVSGIIGIILSMWLNGGWWLVVWFPWVSSYEVNVDNDQQLTWLGLLYAGAFVLTIITECLINIRRLKDSFPTKKIFTATLICNIISYAIGSLVLYAYSFRSIPVN